MTLEEIEKTAAGANSEILLWYACYGSNMSMDRFMCYIRGGIPELTTKDFPGCADPSPPRDNLQYLIPYPLYFAGRSSTWENKGVAFLGPEMNQNARTLGRIYLITREQFLQIFLQENGIDPVNDDIEINVQNVVQSGKQDTGIGWYGLIIFLGYVKNFPVLTFTSPEITKKNPPGDNYLNTIRKGLRECYPELENQAMESYLANAGAFADPLD